jgi:aromatic ring hydroxylase-like protein
VLLAPSNAAEVAEAAAPWASQVRLVPAAPARHDLTGVLLRPDGVVAWACGPDHPPDLEQLDGAMRTWFGAPDSR